MPEGTPERPEMPEGLPEPGGRPSGSGSRPIVIGVGNEFRRDDGIGPAVIAALRSQGDADREVTGAGTGIDAVLAVTDGEPARLVELWADAPLAVVVDAVRAEPPEPGRVHELGLDLVATSALRAGASSHALGLGEAVELGRAVGRMPRHLHVFAVEGLDFSMGPGLTPPVETALEPLARRVRQVVASWHATPAGPPVLPSQ